MTDIQKLRVYSYYGHLGLGDVLAVRPRHTGRLFRS
jgi:hypothetical protein